MLKLKEIHETPFQAFETVHAVNFPPPEQKRKTGTIMSSLKDAKAIVENGNPEGWGQVMDVTPKFDKFGLGFSLSQQSSTPRASNLSTPVKFSHPCATQERHVNAVGDDRVDGYNIEDWIRPSIPGQTLNNWTSVDAIDRKSVV